MGEVVDDGDLCHEMTRRGKSHRCAYLRPNLLYTMMFVRVIFFSGFLAQRIASKRTTTATATINILLFLLRRLEDLGEKNVRGELRGNDF